MNLLDKETIFGVPTTTDRVLQQAVGQVIAPLFESEFNSNSFGFRPNRNARQAVGQARDYIHQGLNYIVDIDLKNFLDEVDHCLLLNLVYQKVKCKTTMRLIRKWLRVPIRINGKLQKRRKVVPQGSALSRLLSNILLHELDKEMTRRKLKFVRYADDFSIYVKSKASAKRVGNNIYKYLRDELKLPINRSKSKVCRPQKFEMLGFGFVPTYKKNEKGKIIPFTKVFLDHKTHKKKKEYRARKQVCINCPIRSSCLGKAQEKKFSVTYYREEYLRNIKLIQSKQGRLKATCIMDLLRLFRSCATVTIVRRSHDSPSIHQLPTLTLHASLPPFWVTPIPNDFHHLQLPFQAPNTDRKPATPTLDTKTFSLSCLYFGSQLRLIHRNRGNTGFNPGFP